MLAKAKKDTELDKLCRVLEILKITVTLEPLLPEEKPARSAGDANQS